MSINQLCPRDSFFHLYPEAKANLVNLATDGQWHDVYILLSEKSICVHSPLPAPAQSYPYDLESLSLITQLIKETDKVRHNTMPPCFQQLTPQLAELGYTLQSAEHGACIVQQGNKRKITEFHYDQNSWKDCLGWLSDQFADQIDH